MSQQPPTPPTLTDQLTDAIIKFVFGGSSISTLVFLFTDDLPKAGIAGLIATGSGLLSGFGESVLKPIKTWLNQKGEGIGNATVQAADRALENLSDFQQQYLEALKTHCYDLEVEGFRGDLPPLALKDVYVALRIDTDPNRLTGQASTKTTIWQLLPKTSPSWKQEQREPYRLAVIADPGSGKTTLTRHLTLCFADGTFQTHQVRRLIPFLLLFRRMHGQIQSETVPALPDLILQQIQELPRCREVRLPRQWIEDQLRKGQCLVMLDGLDEVPEQRQDIVSRWANWQMQNYPTPFVLTSRPHGYDGSLFKGVQRVNIEKFNPQERDDFILKWYRVAIWRQKWETLWKESQNRPIAEQLSKEQAQAQSDAEAQAAATDLINQIIQSSAVKLAENPLLVTIIAATHRAFESLPNRRVRLYQKIVNLLLEDRPNRRETRLKMANAEDNQRVLQVLALELTRREPETTQFTSAEGEQVIAKRLRECDETQQLTPKQFLQDIQNLAGLLVGGDSDLYQFSHKTFQEFLAAAELKDRKLGQALVDRMGQAKWSEVICFFAAMTTATPFVKRAIQTRDNEQLKLAYQLVSEGSKVDEQTRNQLDAILLDVDLGRELSAAVRIESRFNALTPLSATSGMSQPITWGEYRLFLMAQEAGRFHSRANLRSFHAVKDDQPVTGISWEDARWFCAWLCAQPELQSGSAVYDFRLPTQNELTQAGVTFPTITAPTSQSQGNPLNSLDDHLLVVRTQLPDRYRNLLNYLANGRWREADEETHAVMKQVGDRTQKGYLDLDDLKNFPCEDLTIIDQLWVKFNGGRFGFSVQKQLWIEVGGKLDFGEDRESALEAYTKMSDRNGWRRGEEWVSYSDLTFSTDAPPAHLPSLERQGYLSGSTYTFFIDETVSFSRWFDFRLFSRIETCNL